MSDLSTAPATTGRRSRRKREYGSLVLLLPALVAVVTVLVVPLVYVMWRSLYDWQPGAESTWVGVENYVALFSDKDFREILGNQLFYLMGLPLWVVCPLLVAYLLRERVWGAGLWRSIYFLPSVMSPAIVALVFRTLLAPDGPVNSLFGIETRWLTDANLVKPVIIALVLWTGIGTGVLIFSAALSAIPDELFEAARLDGAGFWREFWHIAVPSIRSTVVLYTMFQIVGIFLFMFGWIYALTGGGPGLASATMDFSVYQQFMRFGFFGSAAAQSVMLVCCIIVIPLVGWLVWRVVRSIGGRRA